MDDLGTVLSVWAHPDDEAYSCGALMARAVEQGSRVVCVTATRGELGSQDPERWPAGPELARIRTAEMAASLAELGVTEHHWLDYPDGGCADVPDAEAVDRIAEIMRDVRPDTVLTFGPDGITGHLDHIAISRWTVAAAAAAGLPPKTVHFATMSPDWAALFEAGMAELGVMMEEGLRLEPTPLEQMSIYLLAEGELLDRKYRSLLCQQSQVEPLLKGLGEEGYRASVAEEAFRSAG